MTSIVTPCHPKSPQAPALPPATMLWRSRSASCPVPRKPALAEPRRWRLSPVSAARLRMGSCRARGASEKLGATKGVYGGKVARSSRKASEDELVAVALCLGRRGSLRWLSRARKYQLPGSWSSFWSDALLVKLENPKSSSWRTTSWDVKLRSPCTSVTPKLTNQSGPLNNNTMKRW